MLRRIHVPQVYAGQIPLELSQARHARDVLRLETGATVEVFDDGGTVAQGELILLAREVFVRVAALPDQPPADSVIELTVASAVPKGDRADWMVEKLSELGVAEFLPLAAARSVVLPEGKNKRDRWLRIATESAKQSRRPGVMRIGALLRVNNAMAAMASSPRKPAGWYLSTEPDAVPIPEASAMLSPDKSVTAFVGPEGGWTDEELGRFAGAGFVPVRLTATVLRVETAAIATAAIIGSLLNDPARARSASAGDPAAAHTPGQSGRV